MVAAACSAETHLVAPQLVPPELDAQPVEDSQPAAIAEDADAAVSTSQGNDNTSGGVLFEAGADGSLADVYRSISNSIVYLEGEGSSGSGIVIDGGWILTNAHVVQRFEEINVGRADGVPLGAYPVYGTDWVFDIALVGPVDDPLLVPFDRVPSADLSIGDVVMLLGFPDEDTVDPTPTLTAGIMTRRRQPAVGEFPFLQVDATIAPGQSGGALVDAAGNLIGISGIEVGQGEFGLALESDAMWPRVDRLLDLGGTDAIPTGEFLFSLEGEVGPRRTLSFIVEVDESGAIALSAESESDVYIDVQTLGGITASQVEPAPDPFNSGVLSTGTDFFIDEVITGVEMLNSTIDPGTYQVVIGSFAERATPVQITSENPLRAIPDLEEGAALPLGQIVEGQIDWAQDSDRWTLDLAAGDTLDLVVDGIPDVVVVIRLDGVPLATADDDALGLFGYGAELTFVAPETATYEVEIGSFDVTPWGYLVEANLAG